jgi:hypothetical protein
MAKIASSSKKESSVKNGNRSSQGFSSSEQQEIEKLAYQFFVERGYQHGYDAEDWLRAEAIIRSRRS